MVAKLDDDAYGVGEYLALSEIVRDSLVYDQTDVTNLSALERVLRRLQMIEYHWKTRADQSRIDASGSDGRMDPLSKDLFGGNRGDKGDLMVCPELLKCIKVETVEEVDENKAERKLREGRTGALLLKKAGKAAGKGDG